MGRTAVRVRMAYGDHRSQWIEVALPGDRSERPLPVVIFIHGGYWRDAHAADQGEPLITDLLQHGVAAANLEYRRVGTDPVHGGGGWPQTFTDVAAGLDALVDLGRTAADRGDEVDLDRVVLVGHSAGGQLAAWLAARPGLPDGAPGARPRLRPVGYVSLGGVLDLLRGADDHLDSDAVQGFLGGAPDDLGQLYALASPAARLPIGVPGVCLHGTADDRVPFQQSADFVAAARAAGDDCRLITLEQTGHFEYLDPTSEAWRPARAAALALIGSADRQH